MFIWARFPGIEDSLALAEESNRHGVTLAPGTVFRPHLGPSPWMRFNIAVCEESRAQGWLQRLAAQTID
jgi:DNA-binding transcriptional MocR family regulator